MHSEVWCIKHKVEGHYKYYCPVFRDYINGGGPNLFPPRPSVWCNMCKVYGQHHMKECYLMEKYVQTMKHFFCNFSSSVGHDENNSLSYELMQNADTYRMKVEGRVHADHGPPAGREGFQGRG